MVVEAVADQAVDNILRLGHRGKLIVKVDNEPALLALREVVMGRLRTTCVPEAPPCDESGSNGAIEHAVRLLKEMLRVYLLALERKVGGRIPAQHTLMTWLVRHASECISKYMVGQDGKTPLQRHIGKTVKDEGLEFGELIYYRKRKGDLKGLEARWLPGIWL